MALRSSGPVVMVEITAIWNAPYYNTCAARTRNMSWSSSEGVVERGGARRVPQTSGSPAGHGSRNTTSTARNAPCVMRPGCSRPRPHVLGLLLVGFDLAALHHGEPDVVEAVEQAVLAVRVDLELDHAAVRTADFLLREIDAERRIGAAVGVVEQFLQILRRDLDRQHAVLEAVVVEDVAERGRDHAADAEIHERPRRVLARGAAAEIVARDQDLRLAIGRLVEHEVGILAAVVAIALLREQARAEPGALDGLEVLLGNDRVGVDVDHVQRRRDALKRGELVHVSGLSVAIPNARPGTAG